MSMLTSYACSKVFDAVCRELRDILTTFRLSIQSGSADIHEALKFHLRGVGVWSREITFRDLRSPRDLDDVFVPLNLHSYPTRLKVDEREAVPIISVEDIFNADNRHVVILGQPGAGKTTCVKWFCHRLLTDAEFGSDRWDFPLVLRFREMDGYGRGDNQILRDPLLSTSTVALRHIYRAFGLTVQGDSTYLHSDSERIKLSEEESRFALEKTVVALLDTFHALLVLDGFDELHPDHRRQAIAEIRTLAQQVHNSTIVVTSRSADFPYAIEGLRLYELCQLTDRQIQELASKWLKEGAHDFLGRLRDYPYRDNGIRPLSLVHLCALYERLGTVPDRPKAVYSKVVGLLIQNWDEQRAITRFTGYRGFLPDRKRDFLSRFAYDLTTYFRKSAFSRRDMEQIYRRICGEFDLPQHEARDVIREIESHCGLIVQSGADLYEFAHRSLQEYLVAEHLVRLPHIPKHLSLLRVLADELAVAVAISSDPSEYFCELVFNRFLKLDIEPNFYYRFAERLAVENPGFHTSDSTLLALLVLQSLMLEKLVDPQRIRPIAAMFQKYPVGVRNRLFSHNFALAAVPRACLGESVYKLESDTQFFPYDMPAHVSVHAELIDLPRYMLRVRTDRGEEQ